MFKTTAVGAPRDYKTEARKQWTDDPCGSTAVRSSEQGTPEYFAAIQRNRYLDYAPWLHRVVPFDSFRNQDLLEIGYGQGTDLMEFAQRGARVTGVDLSPAHQRLAQQRFAISNRPATLLLADAESLPFPDESFDGVYSFGVIHHSPNTQAIIDETHRVLRPGGRAILAVYHRRSFFSLAHTIDYIRKGWFLREGLDESYWRIEGQSEGATARPLVKRYSRRQFGRMLSAFRSVRFVVRHFGCEQNIVGRVVPWDLQGLMSRRWGWYLFAFCEK
jgi:ubiquinone/menaquinone biosynthesis C-methylase UbiE